MEQEIETNRSRAVWCVVAQVSGESQDGTRATFEPGTKVYCLPPVWGGGYERVKVVGPNRRGKYVTATVAAKELDNWKAEPVADSEVLPLIAPPWDGTDVSRGVAQGLVTWKAGGHWPSLELRAWNRMNAERTVGGGTWGQRVKGFFSRVLGRESES
jgi:hypothetical protein